MKRLVLIVFLFSLADSTAAIADEKYVTELYDTGQTKVEKTYKNGKLNGPYKMYFENGRPMMRGTMKNDQREGRWEVFYFNGEKSLHSSGEYRNGAWVGPLKD